MTDVRFLIDTSAFSRMHDHQVRRIVATVIDEGLACTCLPLDLEAGYSATGAEDMAQIRKVRGGFASLPITAAVAERARQVQVLLADRGLHRSAGPVDLMVAAAAEIHGVTVLHYDADFAHIASVTGLRQQWIVPRGSLP